MKLSPTDINNKEFKKGIRGYSIDEVDEFLDKIVESYEETFKENEILKENLSRVNEKLDHYEKLEATIQNTLLLAQNAADQAKQSSEKQAELIIGNANETAQRILDKAHGDVIAINDEYERVREEFIKFRAKFRGFMNTQLQTFDELEKDLTKNYNVSQTVDQYELHEKEAEIYNESEKDEFKIEDLNDDIDAIKKFYSNN
ncbi:DivIVA domain-containing protein [Clostridium sp.]|uniref:DivIVA domain-containing protein n=1 Tax=Clostridium sp. TaxID=1506 RepID=UPI0025C54864|nr:DivIVA domain-containing protein [Clostridium sp.]MCI9069922.1 DivIVA domain-containing protein [Clostridium sp.]